MKRSLGYMWAGTDAKAQRWIAAAAVLLIALAIIRATTPDERVVTEYQTVTKHVTDTKVVTKTEVPESCLRATEITMQLKDLTTEYAAASDRTVEIISRARIAISAQDNAEMVAVSEELMEIIDGTDNVASEVVRASEALKPLESSCKAALKK